MGERHHALPARPNLAWYRKAAKQLHGAVVRRSRGAKRAREASWNGWPSASCSPTRST